MIYDKNKLSFEDLIKQIIKIQNIINAVRF
jgi:hypothetical protein